MSQKLLTTVGRCLGETLKFYTLSPERYAYRIVTRSVRSAILIIDCDPVDRALIVGGRGKVVRAAVDLAQLALGPGQDLSVDFEEMAMPQHNREELHFAKAAELPAPFLADMITVLKGWHQVFECQGEVKHERTTSAEVFLVDNREMPGLAMKGLRRFVGWACTIKGRHGFIEWER